jgi:ParB family chromosome partitioning protein
MKRSNTAAKEVESMEAAEATTPPPEAPQRIEFLAVAKVIESKSNPRKSFGDMTELIDSVRTKGVLVPVLCRPAEDGWELVFGARRLRAAQAAGLAEIPAMVRTMTDREVLEVQVIENLQRTDVHPLEVRRIWRLGAALEPSTLFCALARSIEDAELLYLTRGLTRGAC